MKKPRPTAPAFPERQLRVRSSEGWVRTADSLSSSLNAAIKALGGDLSFEDRRKLVRWLCDVYSIEPKAL